MKFIFVVAQLAALGMGAAPPNTSLPAVDDEALQGSITADALLAHAQQLEDFAYATPERNRLIGGQGHNDTITYLFNTLSSLNGYYSVELQKFIIFVQPQPGYHYFAVNGQNQSAGAMDSSPSGNVTAPVALVSNLGCDPSDYPASVAGSIALISRGTCEFGFKSALAGNAGAVGAVIYNNRAGPFDGDLGITPRPEGPYVPSASLAQETGLALVELLNSGANLTGVLNVETNITETATYNVIATTTGGDQDNILAFGAHSDSVRDGPGINDDGSGTVGLLETAIQLSNYSTANAVRFGFWSAEEEGLVGSDYYVSSLSNASLAKIRLYLNMDMIASPNYVYAIYDGDGSAFNLTGPAGSAEIEHFFEDYYEKNGLNYTPTAFDGRSDYQAFIDNGIPAGGLFTGAEGVKTEQEAEQFGGEAGISYDPNYHGAGDNVTNLDIEAFVINTKALAHAAAFYGTSYDSLPPKETTLETIRKRSLRWAHQSSSRRTGRSVGMRWGPAARREARRAVKKGVPLD